MSHVDAACGIGDSIKAYTALFYQSKIASGETVLIADACTVKDNLNRTLFFIILSSEAVLQKFLEECNDESSKPVFHSRKKRCARLFPVI